MLDWKRELFENMLLDEGDCAVLLAIREERQDTQAGAIVYRCEYDKPRREARHAGDSRFLAGSVEIPTA